MALKQTSADLSEIMKPEASVAPAPKATTTTVDLPAKEYHVIDPETGLLVGTIDAPSTFCDIVNCSKTANSKHPFGFINPLNSMKDRRSLWVHNTCMKPTRVWWEGQWRSLVLPVEDVKMPWEVSEPPKQHLSF